MEKKFNSIRYNEVKFLLNPNTDKYEKQPEKIPFKKLPFELWLETTREQRFIQQGAKEVITSRIKNGKKIFYSGLRPITKNYYYGDHFKRSKGEMKKSLCIFWFSPNYQNLTIYYFNNFYKESKKDRENYILSFIQTIEE